MRLLYLSDAARQDQNPGALDQQVESEAAIVLGSRAKESSHATAITHGIIAHKHQLASSFIRGAVSPFLPIATIL